jgi:hypothetical protein
MKISGISYSAAMEFMIGTDDSKKQDADELECEYLKNSAKTTSKKLFPFIYHFFIQHFHKISTNNTTGLESYLLSICSFMPIAERYTRRGF